MASGTYYGIAYASYWTGETGRSIRRRGGKDAQLLGAYVLFNSYMNMLGLYQLKSRDIRDELGLTPAAIERAFKVLADEQYAFYDDATAFVWVREMARFRLGIDGETPLKKDDKKVIGAQRLYSALPLNPWLGPFYDRYAKVLHLRVRREGAWKGLRQDVVVSKGNPSDFEGAPKGLPRGSEASKQIRSGTETVNTKSSALRAPHTDAETIDDNVGVITVVAHEAISLLCPDHPDLPETVKSLCADRRIAYDSATVGKAIDSARVQRKRRQAS